MSIHNLNNLFANAQSPQTGELFEELLAHKNLVIERIISSANITPHEYCQTQDEWVLLVQGEAVLDIAGETIKLTSGDYLFIPANTPHTVKSVSELLQKLISIPIGKYLTSADSGLKALFG